MNKESKIAKAAAARVAESVETEATPVADCATDVAQSKQEILPPESKTACLDDINDEKARALTDDALISECKRRVESTVASQRRLYKDASNLDVLYVEMLARFRCQNLKREDRDGKPTLKQAFDLAGWPYDRARKFHQRYQAWLEKQLLTDDNSPELLDLTDGDTIEDADGKYLVKQLSDGEMQATIIKTTRDGEETVTVPLYDSDGIPLYEKVKISVPTIKVGNLYRFNTEKDGLVHRCVGIGEFRVEKSVKSLAQQREAAKDKKAAAKKRAMKTPLQPRHTLDGKPASPPTSPDGFVKTETKNSKTKNSRTATTVTPKVYVASRVRDTSGNDTDEFAVFYETDNHKTVDSAVSSIYKTMKEAEDHRDRLNAKYGKADAAAA
jgi:hypothetical protein